MSEHHMPEGKPSSSPELSPCAKPRRHKKPRSALARLVETGEKYEDAVRIHSIMHRAIDEDRNIQAGRVYDLAQSFRSQIKAIDPHFDDLLVENRDLKNLVEELRHELVAQHPDEESRPDGLKTLLVKVDDVLPAKGPENGESERLASDGEGIEIQDEDGLISENRQIQMGI